MAEKQALTALFEKYIRKLRITPAWDIRLEFVEDPAWRKQRTLLREMPSGKVLQRSI